MAPDGVNQISPNPNSFFHNSAAKPNYDKPQKTGRLFSRKYEFGTPVGPRNLAKFENRDFRWLLTFGVFGVSSSLFFLSVTFCDLRNIKVDF